MRQFRAKKEKSVGKTNRFWYTRYCGKITKSYCTSCVNIYLRMDFAQSFMKFFISSEILFA